MMYHRYSIPGTNNESRNMSKKRSSDSMLLRKRKKIITSQEKFQIVTFGRRYKKSFRVDAADSRRIIQDSNEGRFLGLFLNRNGLSGPTKRRSIQAKVALTSLQRFRGLTSKHKKKLCTSLVMARLVYHCVSRAAQCDTVKCRMQAVQNRSVNFIGSYNWQRFRRASDNSEL